ncbi:MAG: D-alanyl-lipoteichoic acid acyltransferase DltB (MBOAT superfamily) [Akkermansiaceae bacterium]|jgi:D-alanyl-lipoteichoic acid acyltransferase DltB (MBOAT superfamily)
MNFASLTFWGGLAGGFLLLSLLRLLFRKSPWYDRVAFLVLSLFLLGMESLETVAIFGWVALVGYAGLFCRRRSQLCLVGILMLAPLTYYKYGGFLAEIFSGERPLAHVLIPMGISFYTFQILSIVIDHFREKEERPSGLDYLNFASFFPQIVAGPIERRKDLLPQVKNLKFVLRRDAVEAGIPWIVLGLFLKLALAENFAPVAQEMRAEAVNAVQVWLEAVFFAFRIYFDFAGYSFIAFGLARCLGVRLTLNFRSPYLRPMRAGLSTSTFRVQECGSGRWESRFMVIAH